MFLCYRLLLSKDSRHRRARGSVEDVEGCALYVFDISGYMTHVVVWRNGTPEEAAEKFIGGGGRGSLGSGSAGSAGPCSENGGSAGVASGGERAGVAAATPQPTGAARFSSTQSSSSSSSRLRGWESAFARLRVDGPPPRSLLPP